MNKSQARPQSPHEPLYGIKSKTASYRFLYTLTKPLLPWIRAAFPDHVLTTEQIGRAMLTVARQGYPKRVLESKDIRAVIHWLQQEHGEGLALP